MKGKDKCEFLKGIRKRMAEANGIPYEPRECTYEGECTGTCPFCEKEATELMAALKKKEAEGAEIKKDDVAILAIELGFNECEENNYNQDNVVLTGAEGTLVDINAETSTPSIDPFRGSNNPLMARKELNEMRRFIHELEKPLLGDVRFPYSELNIDDKETRALLQEEEERAKRERERGFVRKILSKIKGTSLQGDIEEE